MALVREVIPPEEEGGWTLIKHYSDSGMMIRQDGTGDLYVEAIDPDFTNRTYTETDTPIDDGDEEDSDGDKAIEILDTLLGE